MIYCNRFLSLVGRENLHRCFWLLMVIWYSQRKFFLFSLKAESLRLIQEHALERNLRSRANICFCLSQILCLAFMAGSVCAFALHRRLTAFFLTRPEKLAIFSPFCCYSRPEREWMNNNNGSLSDQDKFSIWKKQFNCLRSPIVGSDPKKKRTINWKQSNLRAQLAFHMCKHFFPSDNELDHVPRFRVSCSEGRAMEICCLKLIPKGIQCRWYTNARLKCDDSQHYETNESD